MAKLGLVKNTNRRRHDLPRDSDRTRDDIVIFLKVRGPATEGTEYNNSSIHLPHCYALTVTREEYSRKLGMPGRYRTLKFNIRV